MVPRTVAIVYDELSGRFSIEVTLDEKACERFVAWSPPFQVRETISVDRSEGAKPYFELRGTIAVLPAIRFALIDPRDEHCLGFVKSKMKSAVFLWGDTVELEDEKQEPIAVFRAPPLFQQLKGLIPGVPMTFPLVKGAISVGTLELRRRFLACRGLLSFESTPPTGAVDLRLLLGALILLAKRLTEGGS